MSNLLETLVFDKFGVYLEYIKFRVDSPPVYYFPSGLLMFSPCVRVPLVIQSPYLFGTEEYLIFLSFVTF